MWGGGTPPVVPVLPFSNKAATLYIVDPDAAWAPVARGSSLPAGNGIDALAKTGYWGLGSWNPGLFGSTTGFAMVVIDAPFDAVSIEKFYLFGQGTSFYLEVTGPASPTPNTINYHWSGAGMTPSSGTLSVPRIATVSKMLVALVRDGAGNLTLYVYDLADGTLVNSATTALTGVRAAAFTNVLLGTRNSATPDEFFQGTLDAFVSGRNVAITPTELQAIALGADIHATLSSLGSGTYECFADMRGTCKTLPATIAPPSGLATTSAGAVTSGADFFAGSTIRRQSAAQYLVPTMTWRFGQIHGITPAQATRSVTVTAQASAGVVPEFRVATRGGKVLQDWTLMSGSGGNFSGTMTTGWFDEWGVIEFRDSLAPATLNTRALYTSYFAIGPKMMAIGQSQIANNMLSSTIRGDVVSAPNRGKVTYMDRQGAMKIQNPGYCRQADGLTWFIEQWLAGGGGPCLIANNSVGGSSALGTLDNAVPARTLASEQAFRNYIGASYTTALWQWGTADATQQANHGDDYFNAVFFGDAAAITARGYPASLATSHYSAKNSPGGLWDADLYIVFSPLSRHQSTLSAASYASQGQIYGNARKSGVNWAAANGFPVGPYMDDMALKDTFHQHDTDPKGQPLFAARMAQAALRAFGLYPTADPRIAAITLTAPNVYTVTFTLANGGTLYCPAPSAVTGFEVNGSADAALFSAAISGSTVLLTKVSGNWTGTETITYGFGYPRSYISLTSQAAEINGTLYETSPADILGLGLPVIPFNV